MGTSVSHEEREVVKEETKKILQEEYKTLKSDIDGKFKKFTKEIKKQSKTFETSVSNDMTRFENNLENQTKSWEKEVSTELKTFGSDLKTHSDRFEEKLTKDLTTFENNLEGKWRSFQDKSISDLKLQFIAFSEDFKKQKPGYGGNPRTKHEKADRIGWYMMLALKTSVMFAVAVLVFSSERISMVNSCELETALNHISLKHSPHPCKYNSIKDASCSVKNWGIAAIVIHLLFCGFVLFKILYGGHDIFHIVILVVMVISAVIFFPGVTYEFADIMKKEAEETVFDFLSLESSMLPWLEKHYKSDNTSHGEAISIAWNIFFIRYECCGVNEVLGTTNDFDNTPWCTTSGSCQATASQIPRTCCKGVTQDNYQSAPVLCHASVNTGTYKPSCISRMKALSRDNIRESDLTLLFLSLAIFVTLQALEFCLLPTLFVIKYKIMKRNVVSNGQTTENTNMQPDAEAQESTA